MKYIQQFRNWIRLRPLTWMFLAIATCAGAAYIGPLDATGSLFFGYISAMALIVTGLFFLDRRKIVACVLAACMANSHVSAAPQGFQPAAGAIPLGIGLGVLAGGGYICWRLSRAAEARARKRQSRPTNAPPDISVRSDCFAGMMCYVPDYRIHGAVEEEVVSQNVYTIRFVVEIDEQLKGQPRILNTWHTKEADMVSMEQANEILSGWGVTWTGDQGAQYAVAGKPATEADVPFRFGPQWFPSIQMYPDRDQHHIVVETATCVDESANWQVLLHAWVPAGVVVDIEDSPEGEHTFYRVSRLD